MKLDEIKQHNLARFAQEFYGFELTAKATARNPVLECGADNIVIKHQTDGSYTFFSPNGNVKGSIVDFVMWRENCNVKQAVAIASEKITGFAADVSAGRKEPVKDVKPVKEFDREKLASLHVAKFNYYLKSRGVDNIDHGRFSGQVMYDPEYKNAIFPHKNQDGEIIGYSIKNSKFNGFSPGGQKSLWRSNQFKNDKQLVVCEAAIDALSYGKLLHNKHPEEFFHTRFISTEGAYDPAVLELIKNEIKAMPEGAKVIGAFDNDKKGWEFSEKVKELCDELKTNYVQDLPRVKGYDWNDVLQKFIEREQGKEQTAPEFATEEQKKMVSILVKNALDKAFTEFTEKIVNHWGYLDNPHTPEQPDPFPQVMIAEQREAISILVKTGVVPEFSKDEFKNLTGKEAHDIIVDKWKTMLEPLYKYIPTENWNDLTSDKANQIISKFNNKNKDMVNQPELTAENNEERSM